MGNANGKGSRGPLTVPFRLEERPSSPGTPVVVPREGDTFEQLSYINKPSDAVILRWKASANDGGTPIIGYAVERKTVQGIWVRAHPVEVNDTEMTLTGLHPGQTYLFRVKACNAVGWSLPSNSSDPYQVLFDPDNAFAPTFVESLRDTTVMEHERVEFIIEVQGIPPPAIQWFVDAEEVGPEHAKMKVIRDESGISSLVLNDAQDGDGGEIKCIATNDIGLATTTASLNVEAPPRAVLTKKYEEGLIFEDGDVIRLKVNFTGRPRPEVLWFHENVQLETGDRHEIETGADSTVLKVAPANRTDRGEYSLRLQSNLGEDSASFLVTVANCPTTPGKPTATEIADTSIVLTWNSPEDDGGCEITSYVIEYNREGWDMWLKATSTRQNEAVLKDLIAGSTYIFRIKAENPYGASEPGPVSDPIHLLPPKEMILVGEDSMDAVTTATELTDADDTTISSSILLHGTEVDLASSRTEASDVMPDDRYAGGAYASLSGGRFYQNSGY